MMTVVGSPGGLSSPFSEMVASTVALSLVKV
jgi:hypothetical protein